MLSRFLREWSIALTGLCIIVSLLRIGSPPSRQWAGNESANTQSQTAAPQPSANPLPKEAVASIASTPVTQGEAANPAPPPSAPTTVQAPAAAPNRSAASASEPQPGSISGRNAGLPGPESSPATKNANVGSDAKTFNVVSGRTDVNGHLLSAGHSAAPLANTTPSAESAQNCPGNPDAIGTSRVLTVDPAEYPRIGHMQYPPIAAAR